MTDLVALVRSMLDSGASADEIISTLKEMGVSEEDAKRIILLANREILLALKNELRNIARPVVEEVVEETKKELEREIRKIIEREATTINRALMKTLRKEVGKYLTELTHLEERVDLIDRRLMDVEKEVYKKRPVKEIGSRPKPNYNKFISAALIGAGIGAGAAAYFGLFSGTMKLLLVIAALVLILGGLFLV